MEFIDNDINNTDFTDTIQNLITLYFNRDYETICKLLNLEYNLSYKQNKELDKELEEERKSYKYERKERMIFSTDENSQVSVRVYVDEETKFLLNSLLMITSNSIDEMELINSIIQDWIFNVNVIGRLKPNSIPITVGKETFISIKVGKQRWNDLIMSCNNKCIIVKDGFKMALISYLTEVDKEIKENYILES